MNSATIKSYFEVLIKISTFLPSNHKRQSGEPKRESMGCC